MRYMFAALLALGIGITAAVPTALADGQGCYKEGVAQDCVSPAPVYLGTGSDSATVAGPAAPAPSGPYQQMRFDNMGR
jgi:hypothetical protein